MFLYLTKDLAVYLINNTLITMFASKRFTDHWPLAAALSSTGLQPEYVSAPRREALHLDKPLGGTGV